MGSETGFSRRTYLKLAGASSVAGITGLAGCTGGGGGGDEMTITPGTAAGFPPFEMMESGELVGFDIDLLEAVVAETDYTIGEWENYSEFGSLIPALTENEDIDVIAAAMTITDERDQTIDFTDPYYSADQAILVRQGGDFQPGSFEDFDGQQVGAQEGTTGEGVVESELIEPGRISQSNYSGYGSYTLAVQDLENENIDAIVIDVPVARTFASQRQVAVAFTYETGENYGFGVRTDDDELTDALNSGLSTVQDDGTYEEIRNEWFSES